MTAMPGSAGIGSLRLKRLTVAACVLLVAAIAALAIVIHFLDPRSLAVSLAASIKADTGRELRFGEVVFKLMPRPTLVLSDVRFGNAAWGSQPWLAQIGRASADIDVLALFLGRLRIEHIAVIDASVFLETDPNGNGNWVMGSVEAGIPAWLKALEVDEFTLQALAFNYRDGATGKATSVQLDDVRIAAPLGSGPIELRVRGTFGGTSVEAVGTIGALAALIANDTGYPVDLEGKVGVGAASVSVHGTIDKVQELGGLRLALRAQAPELAELVALFGANVPPFGPFQGAAQLTGAVTAPVFSGIDVEVGTPEQMGLTARGELTGRVSVGGAYEWQSAGVDVVVQGARFSDLARWYGKPLPALGRYRIAAHAAGSMGALSLSAIDLAVGGGKTPEIKLRGAVADLRAASGIDLQLEASAVDWWRSEVVAKAMRLPPFRASARLRDTQQGYRVDDLELRVANSTVGATLQVAQRGPRLHITGKATSPSIDLARLPPGSDSATVSAAASELPRPVDFWALADVDLDLNIGRLIFPDGRQLQSGKGRFALDNGRLKVSALQATLGGANIKLDGVVADPQKLAALDLRIALQGGELAELLSFFGKSVPPVGPYQGRAQLRGSLDALGLTAIDASAGRRGQRVRVSGEIANAITRQTMLFAIAANVSDSTAAGRLFGADLPRLPALRATARLSGSQGDYVFDDLRLALGRTSMQGRVAFAPGEPRPRVTANLSGPLLDLSELSFAQTKPGTNPLLAADVEADIRFDKVILANRRALGPMHGAVRLAAGAVELKQFTVAVDGASATVDGKIIEPLIPAALDLVVNAKVTRGVGLAAFAGLRLQGLPAFTASGALTELPNGYALAGLKLAFAATTITGDVAVTRGAKRFKVSAKASAPLLDVSAFKRAVAAESATKPVAGERAIPDVTLPLDVVRVIDADLDLRIDTVKFGDAAPLGPLLVRATMADGLLKAEPGQLTIQPGQTLSVSGTVDAARTAWALRIDGTGINFGELLARFGRHGVVTEGRADLALQLQARGNSLRAILGSLNGDARLEVGPHRVHNFTINPETSIVTRAFTLANPFRDTDPDTEVKCLAARLVVKNGIFISERNFALETAKYNAVVSGTVNLVTEAIDVAVAPVVTSGSGLGIGNVNVIVRLHGTLAAPTVAVDPVSVVVRSAASVGLTVATRGGWWLVDTLLKKAVADPHPCATALARRVTALQGRGRTDLRQREELHDSVRPWPAAEGQRVLVDHDV